MRLGLRRVEFSSLSPQLLWNPPVYLKFIAHQIDQDSPNLVPCGGSSTERYSIMSFQTDFTNLKTSSGRLYAWASSRPEDVLRLVKSEKKDIVENLSVEEPPH